MQISPDSTVLWQWRFVTLNATIVYTWIVMLLLVAGAWWATRNLSAGPDISAQQGVLEVVVETIRSQIRDISQDEAAGRYLPFIGTIFLFIALANLLMIVPGYEPPTGSLSTAVALAIGVFVAVPVYGVLERGAGGYLKNYVEPTPLMLPFNIISELSRTLALAIRLFGNVMSGTVVVGIIVSIAPLLFPIVLQLLGLLTGMIQAYIFAVLAMVYIASNARARTDEDHEAEEEQESKEQEAEKQETG